MCNSTGTGWDLLGGAGGGGGITSLNTLTGATQTFGKTDDTNITLTITSSGSNHQFGLGWTGVLGIARGGLNNSAAPSSDGQIPIWNAAQSKYVPGDPIVSGPAAEGATPVNNPVWVSGKGADGFIHAFRMANDGTLRVDPTGTTPQPVTGTFWQATQPVSGTFWQATQPVSGTFWPTTSAAPSSARLSDGTSFYDATKTGQLPAALDGSGFLKVHEQGTATVGGTVTANQGTPAAATAPWFVAHGTVAAVTASWTSATSVNTALSIATVGYQTCVLTFSGTSTMTGGVLTFEASTDSGTTWWPLPMTRTDVYTTDNTYTLSVTTQAWDANCGGFTNFRARLSTVISGTGTASLRLQASADTTEPDVVVGQSVPANLQATATQAAGNWNDNIAQFGGTNVVTGTGAGGAGIPRVTVSNDSNILSTQSGTWTVQPGNTANTTAWLMAGGKTNNNAAPGATNLGVLPALATAAAQSWTEGNLVALSTDLSGRLRVDNSSWLGSTAPTVGSKTSANSIPVVIASDQGSFPIAATLSAETTKVIGTTRIVGNIGAIFDAAIGAAPPANGTPAPGLGSGATGGLLTNIPVGDTWANINVSTATTTLLITGVSGRHVRITSFNLISAGANNVALVSGTGATCATGTTGMSGGTTAATGWNFGANGGMAQGTGVGAVNQTNATGDSVCVITSAAVQLSGRIGYAIY